MKNYHAFFYLYSRFKKKKKKKEAIIHVVTRFGFGGVCISYIISISQMAMVLSL